MAESESRCFVRVWHDKRECAITGRPVLVVSYRLAMEAFSGVDTSRYDLVFYNDYARERVQSVGMFAGNLKMELAPEPFLGVGFGRSGSAYCGRGLRQVVELDVTPLPQAVTAVTVSVAYALRPQEPFRKMTLNWKGRSRLWIENAHLLEEPAHDYKEVVTGSDREAEAVHDDDVDEEEEQDSQSSADASLEVLVEFKPRVFRCRGLH